MYKHEYIFYLFMLFQCKSHGVLFIRIKFKYTMNIMKLLFIKWFLFTFTGSKYLTHSKYRVLYRSITISAKMI